MNFKQVEAFRAVMMTRSMTAAAGLLHTSQPNVSRWIALLEQALGFGLFQRVGTRLIPTPEAEAFYGEVERAFIGLESLNESASSIRRRGTGLLRVGAVGSITQCVLPDALRLFRQTVSDIPVVMSTGGSDVVAKWMATGFCDIGFCSFLTDIPTLRFERINTAYGVGIVARSHRLARKRRLVPADFANEDFISLPAGSYNRAAIDRHFPDDARLLSIETPYATTICSMVSRGLGVSIVNPVVSRAMRIADLRELPFSEEVAFHSFAVTSEQFPVNGLALKLRDCVHQAFTLLSYQA
ncbi:LysR substrate-binding domain-containing protein [Bordetella holmesii]|uniref:LysR substrate-binding domain protein n=2 Tax=Bordetella holmesii TaxID=35814 RepID=A0A158MA18_9BORD|nr:LysR substrate-binding domain-containing protein [Bordetella holmesii]AHV93761.1 bacterial regulatory helix-turn-helix, lysR family protein [Bordetella holmesii ATCC 51541]AIT27114.1 bacterial regulatory helix-turn-helix, lysR family protein [Bordetella holmesii 44057]EWM42154.1 bacterial regulatory helix-turn-helix, lysR family protein [Bordetella holmesii 41130]EWM47698.1 bacterial regulatory helix-turn-helix, lysR family protein [Bordetella holmesii 35009]AMD46002.1 LysR family transcrip